MEDIINKSVISEFLLLKFSDIKDFKILYFIMFLALYLAAITGNLLVIFVVAFDHHLHTPMYFFLMSLATQDIGLVTVIIPKSMTNAIMDTRNISYSGCVTQVFWLLMFLGCDVSILTIMAYDRYIAICQPLHYEMLMHKQACTQMIASAWITGLLNGGLHAGGTFGSSFCSNVIPQFFCEIPHLLRLACSDTHPIETGILAFSFVLMLGCCVFIVTSYTYIFISVFKIPSKEGREKALSTCLPHLIVFSLFSFTGSFAYLTPFSGISFHFDLALTVMYSLVPPVMNPVIYTMRSKDIKKSLSRLLKK